MSQKLIKTNICFLSMFHGGYGSDELNSAYMFFHPATQTKVHYLETSVFVVEMGVKGTKPNCVKLLIGHDRCHIFLIYHWSKYAT